MKRDTGIGAERLKHQALWYWGLEQSVASKFPQLVGFTWSPHAAELELENIRGARELSNFLLDGGDADVANHALRDTLGFLLSELHGTGDLRSSGAFWRGLCVQVRQRLASARAIAGDGLAAALVAPIINRTAVESLDDALCQLESTAATLGDTVYVRAHGDVHTGNILITQSRATWLIDPRGSFGDDEIHTSIVYDLGKVLHDLHGCYSLLRAGAFSLGSPLATQMEFRTHRGEAFDKYRRLLSTFRDWLRSQERVRRELQGAFLAEALLLLSLLPFHAKYDRRATVLALSGRVALARCLATIRDSSADLDRLFTYLDEPYE